MKIALLGYGKMGKTIERIAKERGHSIIAIIDQDTLDTDFSMADVAIDFSIPSEAFNNIKKSIEYRVPIVSGTTGWLEDFEKAVALCKEKNSGFVYASNFSLGVNLFFELNKKLAALMSKVGAYDVWMEEIHHTQKLDAPSGTAITLAEGIIAHTAKESWRLDVTKSETELPIVSKRVGDVPGTHIVTYGSSVDEIEIKHTAKSRDGFAFGAVIAAEWLQGKTGIFTMKDVLGLQ